MTKILARALTDLGDTSVKEKPAQIGASLHQFKSEQVNVTPEMARDFLRMVLNRPVSQSHVQRLVGIINRGEWRLMPSGVTINPEGYLNGGQHRLRALVLTGRTLPMTITRDVPDEVARLADVGKPWSLSDQFGIKANIVAAVSAFYRITADANNARAKISERQLLPYMSAFRIAVEGLDVTPTKGLASAPSKASAALCVLDRSAEYAKSGYKNMVTGNLRQLTLPQQAYVNWVHRLTSVTGQGIAIEIFCRGLIAFDPQYVNRTYLGVTKTSIETHAENAMARINAIMNGKK